MATTFCNHDSLFAVSRQLGNGTDRRLVSRAHNQLIAVPSSNELRKYILHIRTYSRTHASTLDRCQAQV
jgi:hypothetical protein